MSRISCKIHYLHYYIIFCDTCSMQQRLYTQKYIGRPRKTPLKKTLSNVGELLKLVIKQTFWMFQIFIHDIIKHSWLFTIFTLKGIKAVKELLSTLFSIVFEIMSSSSSLIMLHQTCCSIWLKAFICLTRGKRCIIYLMLITRLGRMSQIHIGQLWNRQLFLNNKSVAMVAVQWFAVHYPLLTQGSQHFSFS